jgi:hypothetical protein
MHNSRIILAGTNKFTDKLQSRKHLTFGVEDNWGGRVWKWKITEYIHAIYFCLRVNVP